MKWGALILLVTLAGVMLNGVTLDIWTWEGTEIIFDPNPSPFFGEYSPNSNCMKDVWDRWHDACNARQSKVI